MKTFTVEVTQTVEVTVDESTFTPEFFGEYMSTIGPLDELWMHAEHLAWVHAAGREDLEYYGKNGPFVEGYGPAHEMGIKARVIDTETTVVGGM